MKRLFVLEFSYGVTALELYGLTILALTGLLFDRMLLAAKLC